MIEIAVFLCALFLYAIADEIWEIRKIMKAEAQFKAIDRARKRP